MGADVRQQLAQTIQNNEYLTKLALSNMHFMIHQADGIAATLPDYLQHLSLRHQDGGMWLDSLGLRAMAVYLKRDILVVGSQDGVACTFYPKLACDYEFEDAPGQSVNFHSYVGGTYCHVEQDSCPFLPASVFSDDTLVIMYNGVDHFWCTEKVPGANLPQLLHALPSAYVRSLVPCL